MRINCDGGSDLLRKDHKHTASVQTCFRHYDLSELINFFFHKLVLFSLWRLVGEFEMCFYDFSCFCSGTM